jgi:hypothetical protein
MKKTRFFMFLGGAISIAIGALYFHFGRNLSATYVGGCSFATQGWIYPKDGRSAFRTVVVVQVIDGRIVWNGTLIDQEKLRLLASQSSKMDPPPIIAFDVGKSLTDCAMKEAVQRDIDIAANCRTGNLCGFGTRSEWQKARSPTTKNGIE